MSNPLPGYIRTNTPLKALETVVRVTSTHPLEGVLEISTPDGVLHLEISSEPARDLRIDLDQFLDCEQ